ncbi:MAG: YceH family protein [Elusimicrobiota bacterium]|nr:MAG: YceH family protein [Elusimicrobiota bacterium]
MTTELNEIEARVLGSLIEKSLTTPELYPLTLNSLVAACNQKTSREPVMALEESVVGQGLHSLIEKNLAGRLHEPGARVPKFMHHAEMLISGAKDSHIAVLGLLFLRGPQTSGELKTRSERMAKFASPAEVESLLQELANGAEPVVAKLPKGPGQKEARWRQLFTGGPAPVAAATPLTGSPVTGPTVLERIAELERRVAALEAAAAVK